MGRLMNAIISNERYIARKHEEAIRLQLELANKRSK